MLIDDSKCKRERKIYELQYINKGNWKCLEIQEKECLSINIVISKTDKSFMKNQMQELHHNFFSFNPNITNKRKRKKEREREQNISKK